MLYVATARVSLVIIGLVLFLLGSALMAMLIDHVRTRVDIWIDPFADPLGAGFQVVQALHAFARGGPARGRPRCRPARDRRAAAHPRGPHGLPAGGARRGARHPRGRRDPRALPRRRRARPAHRRRRGRRLPVAPRDRPLAGHRRPGVHHRGRQPQGPAADRRDAAVHQLRRVVAARQRARHRAPARAVRQGRRTAATAACDLALATDRPTRRAA